MRGVGGCLLVGLLSLTQGAVAAGNTTAASRPGLHVAQRAVRAVVANAPGRNKRIGEARSIRRGSIISTKNTGQPNDGNNNPQPVPNNVWRPFSADSPWNAAIAANPELAPDSTSLINDLRSSSAFGEHLDINIAQYSIPVFYATASTPTAEVICGLGGSGFTGTGGFNASANIPIPAGTAPDSMGDRHLAIVDRDRNIEWGMYDAQNNNGRWTCGVGAATDLNGTGVRPRKADNVTPWYNSHTARACGYPLIAGLIRTDEIDAGRIDHALVIAYPHIRSGFFMPPASTAQGHQGEAISTRGIPCGGRIQLDPNLDLDSLGLTRAGRIVAKALQDYGAYVGDYSGAINLYAENSASAQQHWRGVLDTYEFLNKLDLGRLRVLKFGQLTDDGNG